MAGKDIARVTNLCTLTVLTLCLLAPPVWAENESVWNSNSSINGVTGFKVTNTSSSVVGEVGVTFGDGQQFKLFGRRLYSSAGEVANSYGINYRLKIFDKHSIVFRSASVETLSGELRSNYGLRYLHKLPTHNIGSSVRFGYKIIEDISTQIEVQYLAGRKLFQRMRFPVRVSVAPKWRQHENADGVVIDDVAVAVGAGFQVGPNLSVDANYTTPDKLTNEIGRVAATYSTRVVGKLLSVKLGASQNSAAFFELKTEL